MSRDAASPFHVEVDGVTIVGHERGDRRRRTIMLVHGYPDDSSLWAQVAPTLAETFHVVTYDVRGHGASDDPGTVEGYAFDRLMDDLVAVVDHVSPARKVHLVGHDWGAIQGWEAVTRTDVADRIASFTAISAPSFDHAGWWVRDRLRAPSLAGAAALLRQGAKSWYLAAFQLPVVPEAVLATGILHRLGTTVPAFDGLEWPDEEHPERLGRNAANGVNLYRANLQRVRSPRRSRVLVPVQVVSGQHDAFASAALYADLDRHADDVVRHTVAGGRHWLPRTHPADVATAVTEFVTHGGPPRP